ncbi:hypothetical protein ACFX2I_030815 [Malus domestica]
MMCKCVRTQCSDALKTYVDRFYKQRKVLCNIIQSQVRGPSLLSLIYSPISVFNFPSQLGLSLLLAAISITWLLGSPLQRDSVALFKTFSWNFTSTILVDPHEIDVSTDNTTSMVLVPLPSLIASTSKPKSGNDQRIG